jgi:alpha-tubulin suppressor-like RCC1 family protein
MNISNLQIALQEAISTSTQSVDHLLLAKAIQALNMGQIRAVATYADLPAAASNEGLLVFVDADERLYWSTGEAWYNLVSTSKGLAWAWGSNFQGQLGDGTTTDQSSPVSVIGGFTDWCQVSAGSSHSLGVRTNGTAWAWGFNGQGRLGDGTTTERSSPVSVVGGFTDWCQVSAGGDHSFGLRANGTIWAWGENDDTTLDTIGVDGTVLSPAQVKTAFSDWTAIDTGFSSTVALRSNGRLYQWPALIEGTNTLTDSYYWNDWGGDIFDGFGFFYLYDPATDSYESIPLTVINDDDGEITTESFTAFSKSFTVKHGWAVQGIYRFDISVSDGDFEFQFGAFGNMGSDSGTRNFELQETYVKSSLTYRLHYFYNEDDDASEKFYAYFVPRETDKNQLESPLIKHSWNNDNISLYSQTVQRGITVYFAKGTDVKQWVISDLAVVGGDLVSTEKVTDDGLTVGESVTKDMNQEMSKNLDIKFSPSGPGPGPAEIPGGFTDWYQASAGRYHSLALRTNGTAWAWGCNYQGQLGDDTGDDRSSPVSVVGGFTDWCQVSAGGYHSLALRTNGTAWAWGRNYSGELGDGTTTDRSSPVSVVGGFSDWCQISAGSELSGALRTNGTAWAWGRNYSGGLGDGTTTDRSSPVSVVGGFTDWCQISTSSRSLALRSNDF